jgi:hypothetical protein
MKQLLMRLNLQFLIVKVSIICLFVCVSNRKKVSEFCSLTRACRIQNFEEDHTPHSSSITRKHILLRILSQQHNSKNILKLLQTSTSWMYEKIKILLRILFLQQNIDKNFDFQTIF